MCQRHLSRGKTSLARLRFCSLPLPVINDRSPNLGFNNYSRRNLSWEHYVYTLSKECKLNICFVSFLPAAHFFIFHISNYIRLYEGLNSRKLGVFSRKLEGSTSFLIGISYILEKTEIQRLNDTFFIITNYLGSKIVIHNVEIITQ